MKRKFIVEFEVDQSWIDDGFDITDESALEMLSNALPYAYVDTELSAKVVSGQII